jgi:hypothetical protein
MLTSTATTIKGHLPLGATSSRRRKADAPPPKGYALAPRPVDPSYASEHRRMKPVMDVVRASDDLKPISAGFEVYVKNKLAAKVTWAWHEDREEIIGLNLVMFITTKTGKKKVTKRIQQAFLRAEMTMPEIVEEA